MSVAPCQRVGCVILAAGAGSRLGQPKPLLVLGGRPLVVRAAEAALASTTWPIVVVAGAHATGVRTALAALPVLVAENAAWPEGMASSLRAGLATLRCFSREIDGAVFALCDQPHFSAEVITRLITRQHASGAGIVAARYHGRLGAPALFTSPHFAALESLNGDHGARELIAAARDRGEAEAEDFPELSLDIDTPADHDRARAALGLTGA
jgi:molybdenum cofactor cytidylyltransferase